MDKSYCDSFNVAEAFEKISKPPQPPPSNTTTQPSRDTLSFMNTIKTKPVEP